jgi:cytochrome P450
VLPTFPFDTPPSLDNDPTGDRLLVDGPVVLARMGEIDIWLALSYDAVRQVLVDGRFSREQASGPGGPVTTPSAANPAVLTSMDPPRHNRIRKLMANAFSPRMVALLEPRVQTIVDDLLDRLTPPADLVRHLTEPLPVMVICELLGAPYEDKDRIRQWSTKLMATTLPIEEIMGAVDEIGAYLRDLVAARRAEPDDRLISALVRANDESDHLTEGELISNLQMLLVAGHETTVNQLGNSLVTLLRFPDQLNLLRDRPELLPGAVEELLRYTRLFAATLARVATEDVELAGTVIRKGEPVLPVVSAANRDPAAYPDPHRFDVTREGPAPHTALGHGPHFCLGAQLAKLELRIALGTVIRRFPNLALAVHPEELTYKPHTAVRALTALPLTW